MISGFQSLIFTIHYDGEEVKLKEFYCIIDDHCIEQTVMLWDMKMNVKKKPTYIWIRRKNLHNIAMTLGGLQFTPYFFNENQTQELKGRIAR